ncbi:MAG: 2-oxo-hepta-3-ene-1,7-dioic acid hydratase [Burkholderiaceae bacterium]
MPTLDYEALAAELDQAEQTRTQVTHFSKRFPDITIEDGYAIQHAWVQRKLARGRRIIGHKIGLTSRAMQMASNVTEPDYGALLDDMLFAEGGDIPLERFIVPRVEVELAFMLARPLRGPGLSTTDVLAATEYVVPAIEIIDARIMQKDPQTGDTRKVFDTIADNAANAGVVPGGRPVRPDSVDLRWVGTLLYKNGVIEETGLAASVLNHPATGVAWLANRLAKYDQGLEAGELVLAGSFTRPVFAAPGDTFLADYGPLGNIAFRFV